MQKKFSIPKLNPRYLYDYTAESIESTFKRKLDKQNTPSIPQITFDFVAYFLNYRNSKKCYFFLTHVLFQLLPW